MRISWTGMLRFENCPRQDHLARNGYRDQNADQRVFLTGNVVDNCMRLWLDQDGPKPGTLVPLAEPMIEDFVTKQTIKWKGSETVDRARVLSDCQEALTRLEPWLTDNVLPYPYQPEARGTARIRVPDAFGTSQNLDLFFAADILLQKQDKFVIIDLKTTRNEQYVRGKTLGQLSFYAVAVAAKYGIPLRDIAETTFLTPLCRDITTTVYPDVDDFRVMVQRITRYAQQVWAGNIETKSARDNDCLYRCDVAKHCPMGQEPLPGDNGKVSFTDVARTRKPT